MNAPIFLEKCISTNDEIEKYFTSKNSSHFAVYTFNQTKGRGQYGNLWESSKNQNLAYSIAIPSDEFMIRGEFLNFHTAIILVNFLAIMTKTTLEIKWPNDIIIKNKKVSGILIEKKNIGDVPFFIIGIGLNVLQKDFTNLPKAGSLSTQTGLEFSLHDFTNALHKYLLKHLTQEKSEEIVLKNLNNLLFKKDKVSVLQIKEVRQNGIIKQVDEMGFLWVDLEKDGLKKFYHKEIELLY